MTQKLSPRKAFIYAIQNNDLNTVKELVESKKVKPSGYHNLALNEAIKYNYPDIVEYLLKQKNVFWHLESIQQCLSHSYLKVLKVLLVSENDNRILEEVASLIVKEIVYRQIFFIEKGLEKDFLEILHVFATKKLYKKSFKQKFPEEYKKIILKEKIREF